MIIDLTQNNMFNNWCSKPNIPFNFNASARDVIMFCYRKTAQNLGLSRNNGFNQQGKIQLCLSHSFMKQNGSYFRSAF